MNDGNQLTGVYRDPVKEFGGHEDGITSIATFPDGEKIVTGSLDKTIRIWRLEDGKEMQKWCVKQIVGALIISRDGKYVVSGEGSFDQTEYWELWVRDAETGRVVAGPLDGHTNLVFALDISLDGLTLVSGSWDCTVILWDTTTWQKKGDPLECGAHVTWVQFSPNGQLGVATSKDNQIWDLDRRECSAQFKGHGDFKKAWNFSFTWTHDGVYLLSAGGEGVIRSWDTSMGTPVGIPWTGHNANEGINHIILDPTGTILASASTDHTVRLWTQRGTEAAQYQHSNQVLRVTFSVNGHFIFSGEGNGKLSQWEIPEDVLTAARGDPLPGKLKTEGSPSPGKQKNPKVLFDMEIPGPRRNQAGRRRDRSQPRANHYTFQFPTHTECRSPTRMRSIQNFLNLIRPSSDMKGKQKRCRPQRETPEVVDVPLAPATYGDCVACEEDGIRPYSLFFCLSWFQKKEEKSDPTPQVYDVDLINNE